MQYRKKPIVIEAFKVPAPGDTSTNAVPAWAVHAILERKLVPLERGGIDVHTLEGVMTANVGDFLIKGVKGELYPCKPDIFEATYDVVNEVREGGV